MRPVQEHCKARVLGGFGSEVRREGRFRASDTLLGFPNSRGHPALGEGLVQGATLRTLAWHHKSGP